MTLGSVCALPERSEEAEEEDGVLGNNQPKRRPGLLKLVSKDKSTTTSSRGRGVESSEASVHRHRGIPNIVYTPHPESQTVDLKRSFDRDGVAIAIAMSGELGKDTNGIPPR